MSSRPHCARPTTRVSSTTTSRATTREPTTTTSRATSGGSRLTRPTSGPRGTTVVNTGRQSVDSRQNKPRVTQLEQTLATSKQQTSRQKQPVSSKSQTKPSLSQETIEELGSRFEQLTVSVLNLASSPTPLGARSLETLLTREIADHLGPDLNSPRLSQRFIQATRGLLDNLVCLYEEGKLNPHLLRDQKTAGKTFLRAKSSTNVCYRDKYLKELLMNVLKSMSSNELEEEISQAGVHVSSVESRERVLAIRDMVRTEAGLEPETFKELDRKLAELRMAVSRNQLEMLRAAMEVEKAISDHLLNRGSSTDCNISIPGAARKALRRGCDDRESKMNCRNEGVSSEEHDLSDTVREVLRKVRESRELMFDENNNYVTPKNSVNCETTESQTFVPYKAQNQMENTKSYIEEIVKKELNRAREKRRSLLNKGRFTVQVVSSTQCAKSNTVDVEDDVEDDEDEDEINEEETRVFLEALKLDIEQRRNTLSPDIAVCLEPIDECEDDVDEEEKNRNIDMVKRIDFKHRSGKTAPKKENYSDIHYGEFAIGCNRTFDLPPNVNCPERIESIHWPSNELGENNFARGMQEVFEKLKYTPETKLNTGLLKTNDVVFGDKMFDFTVDEVEKILKNVALKIEQIPVFFQSPEFNVSKEQQKELFSVLNVLGIDIQGAYIYGDAALQWLGRDERFLTSLLSASKSFSFMSKALHSTPGPLRGYPFSALTPPSSLTTTLMFLASSDLFKDCFTTVVHKEEPCKLDYESHNKFNDAFMSTEEKIDQVHQRITNTTSSKTIPPTEKIQENSVKINLNPYTLRNAFKNSAEEIDRHISSFEHYLGLTASVMTVQHISDMFIYLSTVLNEVPDRVKGEKVASLNPPPSFLRALDMLYGDDDSLVEIERRTKFESLTIQDVSNFFLTISKVLQDTPERVRNSSVLEMDPPKSLLKAINLLTSLSHMSILERRSEEDLQEIPLQDVRYQEMSLDQDQEQPRSQGDLDEERPQSSHEKFFDAVDSLTSLRTLSR